MKNFKKALSKALSAGLFSVLLLVRSADGMFSGISKYIPTFSRLAKPSSNSQTKTSNFAMPKNTSFSRNFSASRNLREHIVSKKDGFLEPAYFYLGNGTGYESGFKVAESILRQRQFPTALNNPSYNVKANETKEIQKDLDELLPGTKVMWIPDTLYELFLMVYKDRYEAKQFVYLHIQENPQNKHESLADYFVRLAELFLASRSIALGRLVDEAAVYSNRRNTIFSQREDIINIPLVLESIRVQTEAHLKNKIVFFRGGSAEADFHEQSCFDLGSKGHKADYCKQMAGIVNRDNLDHVKGQLQFTDGDTPVCRSFGATLLANIYGRSGHCVHDYAHRHNVDDGDAYAVLLPKKDFVGNKGLFYVNKDYNKSENFYGRGRDFHPREKAHIVDGSTKLSSGKFYDPNARVITHKSEEDVCKGYAKAKEMTLKNAVPLTPYTKQALIKAKHAYAEGLKLRKNKKIMSDPEL